MQVSDESGQGAPEHDDAAAGHDEVSAGRNGVERDAPDVGRRLLTRRDLARLLRVSTRTLDRRRADGVVLEPLPGAGQPRWDSREVETWIHAGRPGAPAWRRLRRPRVGS